ncbi:MAG TPA: hypothetical protein VKT28_05690 [Puia sp.]|nr:hypothetical protein [Puia sp.]
MNTIEFITLIEPSTKKDESSELTPVGTSLTNPVEWDVYQKKELSKNYLKFPEPVSQGVYQYRLFDVSLDDLEKMITVHIGDTNINKSLSLFGGYAISLNGNIELFPQCCALLQEIQDWKNILQDEFDDFYLKEGHPSPLITKSNNELIIYCKDDYETFFPSTIKEEIKLDYHETKKAVIKLLQELTDFSKKLNSLSSKFGVENLSNIMIWGNNENK